MPRTRIVKAREIIGRKVVRGKEYKYKYYVLPLNLYLPKGMVERWGTEYLLELDEIRGTIVIKPRDRRQGRATGSP